jgi:DNA modification methylase
MLAGCPVDGKVLDPFAGAGTTGLVADRLGRDAILIELNPVYCEMAAQRIRADAPLLPIVITGVEGRFAPEASSSHRAASQRLSSS